MTKLYFKTDVHFNIDVQHGFAPIGEDLDALEISQKTPLYDCVTGLEIPTDWLGPYNYPIVCFQEHKSLNQRHAPLEMWPKHCIKGTNDE